jgi:hypothetical protein
MTCSEASTRPCGFSGAEINSDTSGLLPLVLYCAVQYLYCTIQSTLLNPIGVMRAPPLADRGVKLPIARPQRLAVEPLGQQQQRLAAVGRHPPQMVVDTTTNAALSGLLFAQHLQKPNAGTRPSPRRTPPPPARPYQGSGDTTRPRSPQPPDESHRTTAPAHHRQRKPTPDDSATDPHAATAILVASKHSMPSSTGSSSSILESFS